MSAKLLKDTELDVMGKASLALLIEMMRNGDIPCEPERFKSLLESRVARLGKGHGGANVLVVNSNPQGPGAYREQLATNDQLGEFAEKICSHVQYLLNDPGW